MSIACIFKMVIRALDGEYAVCKLKKIVALPQKGFRSITVTDNEISLVCAEEHIPQEDVLETEKGFSLLKIEGQLDFSLIGILAEISGILAKEKISIFCISTYDTDYILVRKTRLSDSLRALGEHGFGII